MLVGARDHQHVVARHPHVAAEHVGGHAETGHVADVARAVGVRPGDGGQDFAHAGSLVVRAKEPSTGFHRSHDLGSTHADRRRTCCSCCSTTSRASCTNATYLDAGIGGALLVELALGRARRGGQGQGLWARAKVHVDAGAPAPSDPVLAEALAVVARRSARRQDLVGRLGKSGATRCSTRLEAAGSCERQEDTVLGLFPRTRWPAADSRHEADVRRALGDALVRGARARPAHRRPGRRALRHGPRAQGRRPRGPPGARVKTRAKEVAEGDWAAKAVRTRSPLPRLPWQQRPSPRSAAVHVRLSRAPRERRDRVVGVTVSRSRLLGAERLTRASRRGGWPS